MMLENTCVLIELLNMMQQLIYAELFTELNKNFLEYLSEPGVETLVESEMDLKDIYLDLIGIDSLEKCLQKSSEEE